MPLVWKSKPDLDEAEAAALFRALAHPTRLRIVQLLLEEQDRPCFDIVAKLPISQSTVSQHLKVLKTAGIVTDTAKGPRRQYRIQTDLAVRLRKYVDRSFTINDNRIPPKPPDEG